MPELPEVEITVRRLGAVLAGSELESAVAPGVVTMKSVDPPLSALVGRRFTAVRRRGKMLVFELGDLALLVHLMSAGRVGISQKRASLRDRNSRLLLRLAGGGELRLREAGTRQRAWAKLLPADEVEQEEMVATLGPDAWPAIDFGRFASAVRQPRHLHPLLRDQRTIAGIGRSWVDEILWTAALSPFRAGADLDDDEVDRLRRTCHDVLGGAIELYEREVGDTLPQRLPMPLRVHGRQGDPCPRCGARLEAVYFKEHVTTYCPAEQTGGRVLKDRRLSRLLR
jgi:formamidopyrimidine-DNA glycosylase